MPTEPEKKDPVVVILDCEIGHTLDNVLTLALLHSLTTSEPRQAELSAVALTRSNLDAARFADALARFYAKQYLRDFPPIFQRYRGLSVGLDDENAPENSPALAAAIAHKDAEDQPLFDHDVHEFTDTADPVALIRNALTAEKDGACVIVLAGATSNLQGLLKLNGGRQLIEQKVRRLIISEHHTPDAGPLIADWPTPTALIEASSLHIDPPSFLWAENHPAAHALADSKPLNTTSLAAALYAAEPGHYAFEKEGEGPNELILANNEPLLTTYTKLLTQQPAARKLPDSLKRFLEKEEAKDKKRQNATP